MPFAIIPFDANIFQANGKLLLSGKQLAANSSNCRRKKKLIQITAG